LAAVKALRVACFSNMSASRARIGDRAGLREAVEETLKIDPYVTANTARTLVMLAALFFAHVSCILPFPRGT
jgi:hypothetical protein